VLLPQVKARTLDDWLQRFNIDCAQRHQAAADTLATAELLLRLWPAAQAEGAKDFRGFARLASRRRWLP
jgi:DNA polymerase-3 subunit epsilon